MVVVTDPEEGQPLLVHPQGAPKVNDGRARPAPRRGPSFLQAQALANGGGTAAPKAPPLPSPGKPLKIPSAVGAVHLVGAMSGHGTSGPWRIAAAVAVSITWMTVSSLLILVNKHILKDLNFP